MYSSLTFMILFILNSFQQIVQWIIKPRTLLKPFKVFNLNFVGAEFWLSAKWDKTTFMHFIEGVLLYIGFYFLISLTSIITFNVVISHSLLSLIITIIVVFRAEVNDGVTVKKAIDLHLAQGFDLLDFFSSIIGSLIILILM